MSKYSFTRRNFRPTNRDFLRNPKLCLKYLQLIQEINLLQKKKKPYSDLKEDEIATLLANKLKEFMSLEHHLFNEKLTLQEKLFKYPDGHSSSKFLETNYGNLKGLKILGQITLENDELRNNMIGKFQEDFWERVEEDSIIFREENFDKIEEDFQNSKQFVKEEESCDSPDDPDWEEGVMRSLQNGNGEKSGY